MFAIGCDTKAEVLLVVMPMEDKVRFSISLICEPFAVRIALLLAFDVLREWTCSSSGSLSESILHAGS